MKSNIFQRHERTPSRPAAIHVSSIGTSTNRARNTGMKMITGAFNTPKAEKGTV